MISYMKKWPPPKKLMRKYGVGDFLDLIEKGPHIEELQDIISSEAFEVILECCAYAECDAGSCDHPLCPNCLNRTRFALIQQGSHECFEHRLRACLVTVAKKEWEAPLEKLYEQKPDLLADQALTAIRVSSANHQGPVLAIGGVDISLNEMPSAVEPSTPAKRKLNHVWAPHVHVIIMGRDPEDLAGKMKPLVEGVQVPGAKHFRCDRSYCVGRSIAYATALKPERRELGVDDRGNVTRKSRPLALGPKAEALEWLATAKQRIFTHYRPE